MNIKVIVVEDDIDISEEIQFHLRRHGMQVSPAGSGVELDQLLARQDCDVVLLDLGLPGEDGIDIAKRLASREELRVVMLTARTSVHHRIEGFDAGAGVYLTKPVNMQELAAAIQSTARRLPAKKSPLVLDTIAFQLLSENALPLALTSKEFHFLHCLASTKSLSMSRVALEKSLWNLDEDATARRMEALISRLRKKLDKVGWGDLIKTEWRIGYRLTQKLFVR